MCTNMYTCIHMFAMFYGKLIPLCQEAYAGCVLNEREDLTARPVDVCVLKKT
jgi:hypothetical protein